MFMELKDSNLKFPLSLTPGRDLMTMLIFSDLTSYFLEPLNYWYVCSQKLYIT